MRWDLFLTPFVFAASAVSIRLFQVKWQNTKGALSLFQSLLCLVSAVGNGVRIGGLPDGMTVLTAAAFGVLFFCASFGSAECFRIGPMSVTEVVMNSSLLLPVLWSALWWQDPVGVVQLIGIALLIGMFLLSSRSGGEDKKVNRPWLFLLIPAFLANGTTAILQKYQQRRVEGQDAAFLAVAYFTAAVCFFVLFLRRRSKEPGKPLFRKRSPWIGAAVLVAGLGSCLGNALLQSLCTEVPSGVLYPVVNGGLCIIAAAASFLLFKEPVKKIKLAAIALGVAGIVVLTAV